MLKITKLADYAIVILARMANGGCNTTHTARELARFAKLPLPTVSKVLKDLGRAGLVASQRGVAGGYRLAHAAEAISVADVIDAVERPIAITACSPESDVACDLVGACPTEAGWLRINQVVRRALAEISLASMATPEPRLVPLSRLRASVAHAERTQ